jgi:3-mercaptopyruvate sulfurtransferase SseA
LNSDESYNYNAGTGMTVEKCAAYCGNGETSSHTELLLFSIRTPS